MLLLHWFITTINGGGKIINFNPDFFSVQKPLQPQNILKKKPPANTFQVAGPITL